ncbi:MAG: 4-hydroxy-tetrahydrodipicolinate reductase, partial [Planctomycetes bacterium]|nr:4-hydroxy-tetrahydrodipicolinate reductase [Planctomycetota bacterium]
MEPKLIIVGAAGRMGKRILALGAESGQFDIIAAVESKDHADIGKDVGVAGLKFDSIYPAGADVVIDFSMPAGAGATIDYCVENAAALVMGTTGLNDEQKAKVKTAGEKIAIIYGTNMSVGMNVLFSLVGKTASMLGEDYDIEIVEQHHRFKKDAPSGSAITLAENICEATGKKIDDNVVCGMAGEQLSKSKGDIGIHS